MREQKFRFIFKDGNFFAKRYMTLDELLGSNFALEQMEESINSESNIYDIEDYPDYEVFKDEYTGLKDKNGVEIYEGDICRCYGGIQEFGQYEYSGIYEVKYTGNSFDMIKNNCGYGWGLSGAIDVIEVIGNIYENPELLNKI